jgi:hypothetical protein
MPGFDGTGPMGMGPMTGGARGATPMAGLLTAGVLVPGLDGLEAAAEGIAICTGPQDARVG